MEKTWKPEAAGVLSIIAGALAIRNGVEAAIGISTSQWPGWLGIGTIDPWLIASGVVAVIGGIYAIRRKIWPLALAGAILAFPGMWLFGLLALIWIAQRRKEFADYL